MPFPSEPALAYACELIGFLGPGTAGLALFYGIFVQRDQRSNRCLIAHECRHVAQYEHFGSISNFLDTYLPQVLEHGYQDAPLEVDAREAAARAVSDG